ncbi:MAG: hypothetical protein IV100_01390 [Myxococcales bacterium]|nr:hypothetical protein [Myxococcales bacterium]
MASDDLSATSDAAVDTSGTAEVSAPEDDASLPTDSSAEETSSADATAEDATSVDDVDSTVPDVAPEADVGDDDTFTADTGALPAGCCSTASDCGVGEQCVTLAPGLGWCLAEGTDTACWADSDCMNESATCHLTTGVAACGTADANAPAPGECLFDLPCSDVCEDSSSCTEFCWFGMCLPLSGVTGCWNDDFCEGGVPCLGAVSPDAGQCLAGASSVTAKPGTCYAGSGGTCVVLATGDFGDCDTPLGFALVSHAAGCMAVQGCDCGDFCDQVFATKLECQLACLPQTCCADDSACPVGSTCAKGNCVPAAPEDGCWASEECAEGQFCDAVVSCPCDGGKCKKTACKKGAPCFQPKMATSGSCHPIPACCGDEGLSECGGGDVCEVGACVPAPEEGHCWSDGNCPEGEYCFGGVPPLCGEPLVPVAGVCLPVGVTCCYNDDFCYGSCVNGYCAPPADGDHCWTSYDCGLGYTCEGAIAHTGGCWEGDTPDGTPGTCKATGPGGMCVTFTWGSFGTCDESQSLGFMWAGTGCIEVSGCDCEPWCDEVYATEAECLTACAPPICCGSVFDCPASTVCFEGHCVAPPSPTGCYVDTDCGADEQCLGADACTCGTNDCKLGCKVEPCPAQPMVSEGYCAPKPTCCTTNDDCGDGSVCLDWLGAESRCAPAPAVDQCYRPEDCGAGLTCEGENACTCSDIWCSSIPGTCSPAAGGCCDDDSDCAEGTVCTQAAIGGGPSSGQCVQLPDSASCYADQHCPEGQACANPWAPVCGEPGDPSPGQCYGP